RNKLIFNNIFNDVLSVKINRSNGDDLNLFADGDNFFVKIDSNKVRANSEAKKVFKSLKELEALKFIDSDKVTLKSAGLANPKYSILTNLKNNKSEKIDIGNSCGDESVYLKKDNSIKCVDKSILSILDMPVKRFADKNIAPFKTEQIKKVEIDKNNRTLILESDKFGIWKAGTLTAEDTSQKSVQVFLDNLNQKKGYDIIPDDAANNSFNTAAASLEITLEDDDIYKIDFLKNGDDAASYKLAARLSKNSQEEKVLIAVDDDVLDNIDSLELKFRNKTIKNSDTRDAEKIEITGILNQTLLKKGEHWLISEPVLAVAEHSTVEKIISMVSNTEVEHFIDEAKALNPFSKNAIVLKVTFKSSSHEKKGLLNQTDTVTVEMTFGNETSDSERYCKIKGKNYLFTVSDEFYKSLTSPIASLNALRIKGGTAKKVEIKTQSGEFSSIYDGKAWVSTGCNVDERSLERAIVVLEEMKALEAISFSSDIGKVATSIKIYGDDMENPAVIEFSGKRDHINGCLARRTDLNVIYSVPVRVQEKLEELCR
ncbi:MAG: DUF4340 domain-containing protein, partial [Deltaproteobacteria bacterium]|nr:DUF4340 domain-containing protein [Deltaproteobacteria bacterium]